MIGKIVRGEFTLATTMIGMIVGGEIYTNHNDDWNDCETGGGGFTLTTTMIGMIVRGGFTLATTMIVLIVGGGIYTSHNNDWNNCGMGDLH